MGALDFELIDVQDVRQLLVPAEVGHLDEALASRLHLLEPDNPIELGSFHAFSWVGHMGSQASVAMPAGGASVPLHVPRIVRGR